MRISELVQRFEEAKDENGDIEVYFPEAYSFVARLSPIDLVYYERCRLQSDIVEHLPTLKRYSAGQRVLELGTRTGNSTVAFLAGHPLLMVSVDLRMDKFDRRLIDGVEEARIPWKCVEGDSRDPQGEFDVTFVDTWHTADHVRQELATHARKTTQFLIFHDTVSCGVQGEDGGPGIMVPIRELLSGGEWEIAEEFTNNNGLLILRRKVVVDSGEEGQGAPEGRRKEEVLI